LEGIAWPITAKLLTLGAKPGADIGGSRQPLASEAGVTLSALRPASMTREHRIADPPALRLPVGRNTHRSPLL